MIKEEHSVDVIPEGKEDEYLSLEESDEVRKRLKYMLPFMGVLIVSFIAMILIRIFEPSIVVTVSVLSIGGINAIILAVLIYRLNIYIKKSENTD